MSVPATMFAGNTFGVWSQSSIISMSGSARTAASDTEGWLGTT